MGEAVEEDMEAEGLELIALVEYAETEVECIEVDADADAEVSLAVLVSLPDIEAWGSVTLNCCDCARMPLSLSETKLI